MDENSVLIKLSNLGFGYPAAPNLIDGLDFALSYGDKVGIIGPNGCGKTTLFFLIMGLLKPSGGEIEIFGRRRLVDKDFQGVRAGIGFLFQNSDDQLFCPSVEEEIAFGPLNFGRDRDEVKEIVADLLQLVGLIGYEKRAPYNLSGGEKRKLAIATILAMGPRVLLLDEPENGLDEDTVERIIAILRNDSRSHMIISQNRAFLKETTKKLYTLDKGVLIPAGRV